MTYSREKLHRYLRNKNSLIFEQEKSSLIIGKILYKGGIRYRYMCIGFK